MDNDAQTIKDPQIPDNASCIVIQETEDGVVAAVFHGQKVKQNSTCYGVVEQLLSAVLGVSNEASLIEDTTASVPEGQGAAENEG